MTKSTITREQLTEWVAQLDSDGGCDATDKQLETLIRQSLAAMDSEPEYLPLDYLQGHRDGLEWSARLAESNHPQTGDWLYDDPIELAKAIRKGPDMPPEQPVEDSEPDRNPVLAYADSYRDMAKQGVESVPIWSVITDLERNIAPLYRHAQQPTPERDQVRREHAEWSQATFGDVGPIGPLKHLSKEALEAAADPHDPLEWADMQFLFWDAQRRMGISDEFITRAMVEKLAINKARQWPEPKDGEPRLHIKEQPAPVGPEDIPDSVYEILCQACGGKAWMYEEALWNACRAAMLLAGNSPVIPEGYVMVPKEPTEEMNKAGWSAMNEHDAINPTYRAMLAAAPHDTPALNSVQSVVTVPGKWIPVSERMPEDRISVILWDAEIGEVTSGHYSHKTQTFYHCGDAIENEITHWMPPPCAPQEVKGE